MRRLLLGISAVTVIIFLCWLSSIVENKLKQTFLIHWIIKDGFQIGIIRTILIIVAVLLFVRWLKK